MAFFAQPEFLAIAFDASGATTGILAVPFLLALAVGISRLRKDSKASEEDSFGLVAIASAGAIMSVLVLNIIIGTQEYAVAHLEPIEIENAAILRSFWSDSRSSVGKLCQPAAFNCVTVCSAEGPLQTRTQAVRQDGEGIPLCLCWVDRLSRRGQRRVYGDSRRTGAPFGHAG